MSASSESSRKFCFISCSSQNALAEYFDLTRFDSNLDFTFDNIDLEELKNYNPDIIIIDQYFCEKDCSEILDQLKTKFEHQNIYFLSPEYAQHQGIHQPHSNKKHYYSNFSIDILNHINSISESSILEVNQL
ncbi:MAG: hypothetical protein ACPGRW_08610 [Flavobacteriaceae bacterium]